MARYELHLTTRPRRWTPALEALAAGADASFRERVDGFIAGTVEGPLLLLASDDLARITEHWEQCHRDRLAVCIFDHSTLWDVLRDRVRKRGASSSASTGEPSSASASGASSGATSGAASGASRGPEVRVEPAITVSLRARVTLMALCAFVAMVALLSWLSPHVEPGATTSSRADTETLTRAAPAATSLPPPGAGGNGAPGGDARGAASATAPAPSTQTHSGCAGAPGSTGPTPGALLLAFVMGFGLAWATALVVERRGVGVSTAHLRTAWQVATAAGVLVAALSVLLRVAAYSAARHEADADSVETDTAELDDASTGEPDDTAGPFARFLRRRRGAGASAPTGFRGMLAQWRARSVDGGTADASLGVDVSLSGDDPDATTARSSREASFDAGARRDRHGRHEHRERREHHRHHAAEQDGGRADVARLDAPRGGSADARATPRADAATRASAAQASPDAGEPETPTLAPSRAPRRGAARVARSHRRRETPPAPPRDPVSPVTTFALGVVAGLVLSPRWRALARGDA